METGAVPDQLQPNEDIILQTLFAKGKLHSTTPGGGGKGRKLLLPMRTSFQKSHILASQEP